MLFTKALGRILRTCVVGIAVIVAAPAWSILLLLDDGSEFLLNYSFQAGDTLDNANNSFGSVPPFLFTNTLYEDLNATGAVLDTGVDNLFDVNLLFAEVTDGAFSVLVTGSGAGHGSFGLSLAVNRGGAIVSVEPQVIDRTPVPEPATLALLGLGLAGLGFSRRKQ